MKRGFKNKINKKSGFIQITIIIVGILVILKYAYDIDIVGFLTTGKFRHFLDLIYGYGLQGWQKYSETILSVWNTLVNLIKNLISKSGGSTNVEVE